MYYLTGKIEFPEVSRAHPDGLLAIGGDLSTNRLIAAYERGIFPWFGEGDPILWWSPDPRFVLFPDKLNVSKSMRQVLRKSTFEITTNKDFEAVINHCAKIKRGGQTGTWISHAMINAYIDLHGLGVAKSIEVWEKGRLVGGFYGIDMGSIFFGESMFSMVDNASKAGFISFVQHNDYRLIDCQVYTRHMESLGAEYLPRAMFLKFLIT
jgi:leucyl/phenylalanyl-tRNA--protein transferase